MVPHHAEPTRKLHYQLENLELEISLTNFPAMNSIRAGPHGRGLSRSSSLNECENLENQQEQLLKNVVLKFKKIFLIEKF